MKLLKINEFHCNLSCDEAIQIYDGQVVPILMYYNTTLALPSPVNMVLSTRYQNGVDMIVKKGDPIWIQYNGTMSDKEPSANNFRLHVQGVFHNYTAILNLIAPTAPQGRLSDPYHYDPEQQIRNIESILFGKTESYATYKLRQVDLVASQLPTESFVIDSPTSSGGMGMNTKPVQVKDGMYFLRQTFAEGGVSASVLAGYMTANAMCIVDICDSDTVRDQKWFAQYNRNQDLLIDQYQLK